MALVRAGVFWLATMAVLALSASFGGSGNRATLIVGALAAPATFVLAVLFIRWEGHSLRDYFFEVNRSTWLRFSGGLLLGFSLVVAQTALMFSGGGIGWTVASPTLTMLVPVAGYLLLATREELAFRGYPLRKLASEIDPWSAQIFVAILFVTEHRLGGSTWIDALIGSGIGALVFGMAALATRGLAFPIGLHAAWNIGDWARGTKSPDGLWQVRLQPGLADHVERVAILSYVGVMSIAFAGLWLWYRKSQSGRRS